MKNNRLSCNFLPLVAIGALMMGAAAATQAQTIYRIVGANGKVTFSDKPPVSADQGKVATTGFGASAAASGAALPFELRQIIAKYPVTLYASPKCAPCDSGRGLLTGRGVPFTERTVTTAEDIDYFQRLSGDGSLPFLTIGSQRIKGMSDVEWTQYLDAAGYPKTSQLPTSYKGMPATPLVTVTKTTSPKPEPKVIAPAPEVAPPAPGPTPANPTGIQF